MPVGSMSVPSEEGVPGISDRRLAMLAAEGGEKSGRVIARWTTKLGLALLLSAMAVAACAKQPTVTQVTLTSFAYDPPDLVARPGETIRLELSNPDSIPHTFDIPELGIGLAVVPGASVPLEFVADQAGTYTFFCGIPGHREAGMEGTLSVGAKP